MCLILKVWNQAAFESADLNQEFRFAISIQSKGTYPAVLRPDFQGQRLDLYFDDVTEGTGVAPPADIDALFDFSSPKWLPTTQTNPSFSTNRNSLCSRGEPKCRLGSAPSHALLWSLSQSSRTLVSYSSPRIS